MYREDFIKRQIELLGDAIAKIAGKRDSGLHKEALEEARKAYRALGVQPNMLEFDAKTLVSLIGDPGKLLALCSVLEEEAHVHDALGHAAAGAELRVQANEIRALVEPEAAPPAPE